jgi:excinuclease UvrABC helicase subunit UvrB
MVFLSVTPLITTANTSLPMSPENSSIKPTSKLIIYKLISGNRSRLFFILTKQTYSSPGGHILITNFVRTGDNPNKGSSINVLKSKLQKAINEENFEDAVKIRDEIKNYEKNQDSIHKLEMELKKSIEDQDFEKSIEIRDELKKLKS